MAISKKQTDNPFAAQREKHAAENKRSFGSYLKTGETFGYVVAIGDSPSEYYAATQDIFVKNGAPNVTNRYAVNMVIMGADNETGLKDGWENSVIPMVLPKAVRDEITELGFEGATLSHVDADGKFHAGTLFKLGRHGTGLSTRYTVRKANMDAVEVAVPKSVTPADETVAEFAMSYTTYQQDRATKQIAEQTSATPEQDPASSDMPW